MSAISDSFPQKSWQHWSSPDVQLVALLDIHTSAQTLCSGHKQVEFPDTFLEVRQPGYSGL